MGEPWRERRERLRADLRGLSRQEQADQSAQGPAEEGRHALPRDGRRPRRGSHQLAPAASCSSRKCRCTGWCSTKSPATRSRSAPTTPREVDDGLVRAQETRRILDRLYGYEGFAAVVAEGASESALRRARAERRRAADRRPRTGADGLRVTATWWDLLGRRSANRATRSSRISRRRMVTGRWPEAAQRQGLRPEHGQAQERRLLLLLDEAGRAGAGRADQERHEFRVASVEEKPYTTKPYAPFTTSTLQQEANRKLGFTARRTMQVAQSAVRERAHHLHAYRLDQPVEAWRSKRPASWSSGEYGEDYLPVRAARRTRAKVKNAQEAHEAIRPAGTPFDVRRSIDEVEADRRAIQVVRPDLEADDRQPDGEQRAGRRIVVTIEGEGCVFTVSGKTIDFPGYLRAYVEGSDDPNAQLADQEKALPSGRGRRDNST